MKEFHLEPGPYIKSNNSTSKMMFHLLIALLPIVAFSFLKNGVIPFVNNKTDIIGLFYPLIFIAISTLTSLVIEMLYARFFLKKKDEQLKDYMRHTYSVFPGLFLALILPINTPISILIFGGMVATVIGKMLFGGFGHNIFNPALVGYLFIGSIYAATISSAGGALNSYEMDAITTATPLSNASVVEGIGSYNTLVEPYGGLWNFFIGTIPGAVGETSALFCLLGLVYLLMNKVIKWQIPIVYISTVFGLSYMIGAFNNLGIWYPLFQIMSGGVLFGAIFMATDPVTSPTTPIGKTIYALFLGILTVMFRHLTPYPEGVLTSILTMNMLVFIIDRIGFKARFNFSKAIIAFVGAWLLILGLGVYIGNKYLDVDNNGDKDPDYTVISKNENNNKTTYVVSQEGFSGKIKAEIVIDKGVIKTIEILEKHDSYFQKVTDSNYIAKIINEQNNLAELDTVSGATISSTAVKKMVINTMDDYNGKVNYDINSSDNQENITDTTSGVTKNIDKNQSSDNQYGEENDYDDADEQYEED